MLILHRFFKLAHKTEALEYIVIYVIQNNLFLHLGCYDYVLLSYYLQAACFAFNIVDYALCPNSHVKLFAQYLKNNV